jgi:hypothetical protein
VGRAGGSAGEVRAPPVTGGLAGKGQQGLAEGVHRREARVGLPREGAEHRGGEGLGHRGPPRGGRRGRLGGDRLHEVEQHVALEGPRAHEALVEHHPEGPLVRARGDVLRLPDLLGGHVRRRAEPRLRAREVRRGVAEVLRDAEIHQHGMVRAVGRARQEHVGGLHVAVHDALAVHGLERRGHGEHHVHGLFDRELSARREPRREGLSFEVLHRHVSTAVDHPAVEHGHHVRVLHRRGRRELALEALQRLGPRQHMGVQHLERHAPQQRSAAGLVHHPEGATPDLLHDLEGAKRRAGLQRLHGGVIRNGLDAGIRGAHHSLRGIMAQVARVAPPACREW